MKVMVVDGGARGHVIAQAYLKSPHVDSVVVTPGKTGMEYNSVSRHGNRLNIQVDSRGKLNEPATFLQVANDYQPDLIDVAQDDALVLGGADLLREEGYRVFGPTAAAAQIEGSKGWARKLMGRHRVPGPEYQTFVRDDKTSVIGYAMDLLSDYETIFFKADGLAAGKGVIPVTLENLEEAYTAMQVMGKPAETMLVEVGMVGEEFSFYAMCDGENYVVFPSAADNKRIGNQDTGPMTGGMGTNCPALVTVGLEEQIEKTIVARTLAGMASEDVPFVGIAYFGGIVDERTPKVIEVNCRPGDPEWPVVLPGVQNDYFELVNAAVDGDLVGHEIEHDGKTRVCVVAASAGYPESYEKGKTMWLDTEHMPKAVEIYDAGIDVELNDDSSVKRFVTAGGRLADFVGEGNDVVEARRNAMQAIACCSIEDNGLDYRTDVAWRDVERVRR